MKVLLTGHKGYIGAVAAPVLKAAGHEVVGLDTDLFTGCDFAEAPLADPGDCARICGISRRKISRASMRLCTSPRFPMIRWEISIRS